MSVSPRRSFRALARVVARVATVAGVLAVATVGFASAAAGQGAQPGLTVAAPSDGGVIAGMSVTVRFTVSGIRLVPSTVPLAEAGRRPDANRPDEGHVHFMLDAQPLVVWERADPYTFTNVPPGDHVMMIELVQNDHGGLTPPVVRQIRFRTTPLLGPSGAASAGAAGVPGALVLALVMTLAGLVWRPVWQRSAPGR
jgi:hypothetical protein